MMTASGRRRSTLYADIPSFIRSFYFLNCLTDMQEASLCKIRALMFKFGRFRESYFTINISFSKLFEYTMYKQKFKYQICNCVNAKHCCRLYKYIFDTTEVQPATQSSLPDTVRGVKQPPTSPEVGSVQDRPPLQAEWREFCTQEHLLAQPEVRTGSGRDTERRRWRSVPESTRRNKDLCNQRYHIPVIV